MKNINGRAMNHMNKPLATSRTARRDKVQSPRVFFLSRNCAALACYRVFNSLVKRNVFQM